MYNTIGVKPTFFRAPYDLYNNTVREYAYNNGQIYSMYHLFLIQSISQALSKPNKILVARWSMYSYDVDVDYHNYINTKPLYNTLFNNATVEQERTILTADWETVDFWVKKGLLAYVIEHLQGKGYKLVTLADCLGVKPYFEQKPLPPYKVSTRENSDGDVLLTESM